jgi:hypothetical protein
MKNDTRILESTYLEALAIVRTYQEQLDMEVIAPVIIPKKGDTIELLDISPQMVSVSKGGRYQVYSVHEYRHKNGLFAMRLVTNSKTYHPEVRSNKCTFKIVETV